MRTGYRKDKSYALDYLAFLPVSLPLLDEKLRLPEDHMNVTRVPGLVRT